MSVTVRKQLLDLPAQLATKVTVVYYSDARDVLLKRAQRVIDVQTFKSAGCSIAGDFSLAGPSLSGWRQAFWQAPESPLTPVIYKRKFYLKCCSLFLKALIATKSSTSSIFRGVKNYCKFLNLYGRGERIRTSDPLVPNQVLYQAEPLPDAWIANGFRGRCLARSSPSRPTGLV